MLSGISEWDLPEGYCTNGLGHSKFFCLLIFSQAVCLFLFFAPLFLNSSSPVSAAKTQTLPVLQDQERPQQERWQLLPEQQRKQDGAPLRCEQQHGPSLQHWDGPAAQHQPPHSSSSSGYSLRSSSHVALTTTQPDAVRLGRTLLHGAHL